jgi:hypothetical protein
MENFKIDNPTILHFGKDVTNELGETIKLYGKKVLIIYGGGSIKTNGIYDTVIHQLNLIDAEYVEYSGIKSNPIVEDVNAAAEIGKAFQPDLILAVGGGSVIDSAKVISLAIPCAESAWRIMLGMVKPTSAIPIITILTLAATGTEMNAIAVIQNDATHKKLPIRSELIYPKHSFLDPQNTFTVPRDYTAYGVADLIAHALEAYFGAGNATLSDRFVFSIIHEAMDNGPALLDDLRNYDLRARIMYAATQALNGLTLYGRVSGEWGVHSLGHILSLMYDVPHGASLTIVYPAWLKYHKEEIAERILLLGKVLFNVNGVDETIFELESFFRKIECPIRMKDIDLGEDKREEMIEMMIKNKVNGACQKLNPNDITALVDLMY